MKELYEKVKEVTVEAGKFLLSQSVEVRAHKTGNDLLTENDLQTERFIIEKLRAEFPEINILSEEFNSDSALEGTTVIIDPIDGTCNFAVGLPLYGIQLAVAVNGECVFAVMYFPESDELITAEKNMGAFINGKPLRINGSVSRHDGVLAISDYYEGISYSLEDQFELIKSLQKDFLKTRHFGAACIDFSYLAKSHVIAYITYYHKIWDVAPGLLIASEAGCVYSMLNGEPLEYGLPGLAVANNSDNLKIILEKYKSLQIEKRKST